jgi:hypothetical protein
MAGWKPDRVEHMQVSEPHPRQGDDSLLYLWIVPAEVRGAWKGGGWQLHIDQSYQEITIDGTRDGKAASFTRAAMNGREISWRAGEADFRGQVAGERIVGELTEPGAKRALELQRAR